MKTKLLLVAMIIVMLSASACTPTQTATVTTEPATISTPTEIVATATTAPTATPTVSPTPTLMLRQGIDVPVTSLGIDIRFTSITTVTDIYLTGMDQPVHPAEGNIGYAIAIESLTGADTLKNWPSLGKQDTYLTLSNGQEAHEIIFDNQTWYIGLPEGITIVSVHLPDDVVVDLTPLLPQ